MKTFLIDLEHVKNQGLVGVELLSSEDRVFIFYSEREFIEYSDYPGDEQQPGSDRIRAVAAERTQCHGLSDCRSARFSDWQRTERAVLHCQPG